MVSTLEGAVREGERRTCLKLSRGASGAAMVIVAATELDAVKFVVPTKLAVIVCVPGARKLTGLQAATPFTSGAAPIVFPSEKLYGTVWRCQRR